MCQISYRTCPNLKSIIAKHNAKILKRGASQKDIECNCRKNTICPIEGKCMYKDIIYQALVTQKGSEKVDTYIGLTSTTFKARLANHQQAFKNKNLQTSCKLAQFIWGLKEKILITA